ncbi:uncharacterized protein A1O9_02626 [Exophiala aquamarina CBS 119918]|uniref:ABC transporter domain-containing protein n=1 Tax=Exophiala aquamarina CBS 119918 TaxID=1182545 RepID=A0A072PMF7_9EURO|nr:uncharacterized protein A1O9_02626 [Exophiala aquamarina CBS 119918]KEF61061.1 hypothetical protein A1O9_02626 [Exophiala aquamarina CBS 119918]
MATVDIESVSQDLFTNTSIQSFSWQELTVTVKDRKSKLPLTILDSCSGNVQAGQLVALMGPSGSGKTTLLNVLAMRSQIQWAGQLRLNSNPITKTGLRGISRYVEQEDALIGSLTVRETIDFSARLALHGVKRDTRRAMVNSLITAFGLRDQQDTIIGTPIRKGISGGQKRRVSVASQLVTSPKILFLDEPTSGLDSAASYEVMKLISEVTKKHKLIVIASIHQPSTTTFELFDKLLLLSHGKTCYFGPVQEVDAYFGNVAPIPMHTNPAEFLLDLVNTDFTDNPSGKVDLARIQSCWTDSAMSQSLETELFAEKPTRGGPLELESSRGRGNGLQLDLPVTLLHRNFIKSYRDLLAYGTRVAMYTGLAILMGTVWLRLDYTQSSIQPFINALFFGGAFMSFMAVAYVPSVIEDLWTFNKEYANGLYGPLSFMVANFLIGIPWLLLITLIFSVITYWLSNFHATASGFWIWVLFLFLDLLAAESLVVLFSSIFPIFVVALAAIAFANGLWMSVGGFLVPMGTLNVFWKYVFHYIDYQAYVFQAMMVNQFKNTVYDCDPTGQSSYYCMYKSDLQDQGKIRGTAVLEAYHYSHEDGKIWEWFGIMLGIIVVYRLLGFLALWLRTRGSR